MEKFLFDQITGHEFKESHFDKVILPIGSTEYHGDHLPFGTDTIVAYELAKEVARRVDGLLLLPPIYYGMSDHYSNFLLTISVRAEILIEVIKDVLYSIIKHNINKIFIVNGHDGNIAPIEIATRAVKVDYPDVMIFALNAWWVSAGNLLPKDTFEVWEGLGHAGEGETSMMLSLRPELVQMEHARGVVPELPQEIDVKWLFDELTPYGVTGDPTKATKAKGDKMKEVLVNLIVSFFEKMEKSGWTYGYRKEE